MPTATTTRPDRRGRRAAVLAGGLLLALQAAAQGLVPMQAQAQALGPGAGQGPETAVVNRPGLVLQPALQLRSLSTNNVSLTAADRAQSDTVLVLTPRLDARVLTPGLRLNAALAADMVSYVGRTRSDRILPKAQADATLQLVERWLFLDAGLSADTTASDPFGVLDTEGVTVFQRSRVTRERISPYLDREIGPGERVQLRSDHSWVQSQAAASTRANLTQQSQLASYALEPAPLGGRIGFDRSLTRDSLDAANDIEFQTLRLEADYAVLPAQLVLLATTGRDQGRWGGNDQSETLAGAGFKWTPDERSRIDLLAERRFFGTGWTVDASHRSPFLGLRASLRRQASTYAAQIAAVPAGSDLGALFDAMLSTRIPNPAERAAAVSQLIAQRNLPTTAGSALNLYSATAQLQQTANVSLALLGVRHTVTLSGFYARTEDMIGTGLPPLFPSDARQFGGTLTLSRRLDPQSTADLALGTTRIVGIGRNTGIETRTRSARLSLSRALTPRTTATGGLYRQWINSTTVTDANQTTLALGLLHRF